MTVHNVEEYIERTMRSFMSESVALPMAAFRDGFSSVFPITAMGTFSPDEFATLLNGAEERWEFDGSLVITILF